MWDVVEHLPDPKRTLLTLSKKLKNRGILFLNTVNYASIFRKIFGKKYWFIERMHIYYFTPQTMRKMLEACGYEVLRIIPHFKALSLGYFIERIREISIVPAAIISPLSSFMHAGKHIISVYAGQMTVIARKKG
jgi:2-polyprenyl-3-methyl-5-hydroxy-6-metoxy-1,4-benzoquinol methylase